jgi:hypothetical protein
MKTAKKTGVSAEFQLKHLRSENRRLTEALKQTTQANRQIIGRPSARTVGFPKIQFTTVMLRFVPTHLALTGLQDSYVKKQEGWYQTRLLHALAQLMVVDDAAVQSLYSNILSFSVATRSLAGLESLFLSCMHNAWLMRDEKLYRAGIDVWHQFRPNNQIPSRDGHVIFYDREASLMTFISVQALSNLRDDLSNIGFFGQGGIGGTIRGNGYAADNANGDSFSRCLAKAASMGAIGGAIAGAIAGAIGGFGAGTAGGAKAGAEFGALGAAAVFAWVCEDDSKSNSTTDQPKDNQPKDDQPKDDQNKDQSQNQSTQPTQNENDQQQSLPEEHPDQSIDVVSGGYPTPDGSDGGSGGGNPAAQYVETVGYPNPDGVNGGPAGMPTDDSGPVGPLARGLSMTFLMHGMPRLAPGNQTLASLGFLSQRGL